MKYICVQKKKLQNMKIVNILQNWSYGWSFVMNFFVVNDIDIHQLNLGPFKSLKSLVENPFKKCISLHFLNNNCIVNFFFGKKP